MLSIQNAQVVKGRLFPLQEMKKPTQAEGRGINCHGWLAHFFVDKFGSGTIEVQVDQETFYLNKASCFKWLKDIQEFKKSDPDYISFQNAKVADIASQIQTRLDYFKQGEPIKIPSWPENPTSANDLPDFTSDQVASAPIALIEKLLKKNFFNDDKLRWQLLPYLSDQHLEVLSLANFTSEFQLAIALMGKENPSLKFAKEICGPFSDLSVLTEAHFTGPKVLAEVRRRFSLVATGAEVKEAIQKKSLSPAWLGYLTAKELADSYTFKELTEQNLILWAFSPKVVLINYPAYLPGEKLRFASFDIKEIQAYLENLKEEDYLPILTRSNKSKKHIWEQFQFLLSDQQIQGLNFEQLGSHKTALIVGGEGQSMYKALRPEQKETISTQLKRDPLPTSSTGTPFFGSTQVAGMWRKENEKRMTADPIDVKRIK